MPSTRDAVPPTQEYPLQVLREYSLLADGESGVLVGSRGDFAWMCVPSWESDAVFSSLLDGVGMYALTPVDQPFVWGGCYEGGSLIWHSRWVTCSQSLESREALAFPGDRHTAVVLRRVMAVDGATRVRVVLDPQAGFGKHRMRNLKCRDGVWTARSGPLYLRWSGAGQATVRSDGALEMDLGVAAGAEHDLVLELSDEPLTGAPVRAERAWSGTVDAWRHAVRPVVGTIADSDARQAYAVLRGLTSSGGGMAAAATMGLPERAEEGRNYDYRYAWIRDQCYAGRAISAYGADPLFDDVVRFVADRVLADGPDMKPAYTVHGGPVPDERELDLAGYPGGTPRVGNWVTKQFQLDSFGEALLLFASAAARDHLGPEHWRAAETAIAVIADRWREPDAGIWELNDQRWAHSRLTCVAGLRAIAAHAPSAPGARWNALADVILADAAADCLHPSGRWQRAPGDDRMDAALLIPAVRGAVPADDPRTLATLAAALDELAEDNFMYRFRHDERPVGEVEGAFLLCGLITSLALHQQGREVEAHRWFERNRTACGPPGLFAEEFDLAQRQLRGNLPQAFVHALMLEAARSLAEPWPQH